LISGQVRFLRQFARHQFQVIKDTLLGLSLHRVVLGIRVKFLPSNAAEGGHRGLIGMAGLLPRK
jgi:hypothetical protein